LDTDETIQATPAADYTKLKRVVESQRGSEDIGASGELQSALSIAFDREESLSREAIREAKILNRGLDEYYNLRKEWSHCLKWLLGFLIVFQCFVVIAVGFKWMDFSKHQDFLKIQASGYFAQIVGLCYVVVKYLFQDVRSVLGINKENKTGNVGRD
jgi:hypothetical protein